MALLRAPLPACAAGALFVPHPPRVGHEMSLMRRSVKDRLASAHFAGAR